MPARSPRTRCSLATVLALAAILLTATAASAAQSSDTVNIDAGQHAALQVDFTDGPAMEVSYDVQVTEGPNIDVLVLDNANYQKYRDGESFSFSQSWSDLDTGNTEATFTLQEHGTWWIVLDHTGQPDDGTGPSLVGAESVTARYTLETNVDVKQTANDLADRIPAPGLLALVGVGALAALSRRR